MSDEEFATAEGVRRLLAEDIDTLDKLELLLLLLQQADKTWTIEAAASAIRLPVYEVEEAAQQLAASGIIVASSGRSGQIRFAPVTVDLESRCRALAAAYRTDPVEILKLANRQALARIRKSATAFADAFRFRRRKPEGDDHG